MKDTYFFWNVLGMWGTNGTGVLPLFSRMRANFLASRSLPSVAGLFYELFKNLEEGSLNSKLLDKDGSPDEFFLPRLRIKEMLQHMKYHLTTE